MPNGNQKRKRQSAGSTANVNNIVNDVLQATGQSSTDQIVAAFVAAITKFADVITKMDATLDSFNDRLEKLEGELHEVKLERDHLLTENRRLEKELETKSVQLEIDTETRQRERRASNIKLTGMEIGGKSNVEIVDEVLKLHNENVHDDAAKLDKNAIASLHIIKGRGTDDQKKPDSVIVTLQNPHFKKSFYTLSKKMREKKTRIFVGDDLTPGQRRLLFELKQRTDLFIGAVIRDGAVRCFKKGGGFRQFAYLHELQKLPPVTKANNAMDDATQNDAEASSI